MAKVFEHPLTLIYNIGKSLIVNGVDIYHKINDAINAYDRSDYFNFGRYIGEAMDEVFFHNSKTTQEVPMFLN